MATKTKKKTKKEVATETPSVVVEPKVEMNPDVEATSKIASMRKRTLPHNLLAEIDALKERLAKIEAKINKSE